MDLSGLQRPQSTRAVHMFTSVGWSGQGPGRRSTVLVHLCIGKILGMNRAWTSYAQQVQSSMCRARDMIGVETGLAVQRGFAKDP